MGGFGAFFLLLDEPEVYGLPPDPQATTRDLGRMWRHAAIAAAGLAATVVASTVLASKGGQRQRAVMMTGASRRRRGNGGEVQQVPDAEFSSYYGRPVVQETVWGPDIPSYLFLGGLAGASSGLAAGAHLTGNRELALAAKAAAAGAISLSMAALVHDLGRPARFINMLRVLKVTSPMNVGSWILSGYTPLALAAAACAITRKMPLTGIAATIGAAALGPAVASYTAVLLSDTATPAWHGAYQELPYLFVGSAASAAGGFGMLAVRPDRARQAVRLAVAGATAELTARHLLERRLGDNAEPYHARPARNPDEGRGGPDRGGPCWRSSGSRPPGGRHVCRRGVAGGVSADAVRRFRGWPSVRQGPEVHGRPAARQAAQAP